MVDEEVIFGTEELRHVNIPDIASKIYKDECVYSFDTPLYETGLYVCLKTFYGIGKEHLERHYRKTGSRVYLHMRRKRTPVVDAPMETTEEVTRLAIGVEGGFQPEAIQFETEETYTVVVYPQLAVFPWPNDNLPSKVSLAVDGIIAAESVVRISELSHSWDGEVRLVTKHAENLQQLNNNKRIPPTGWKCEKCDLTTNLWLNLTDGSILCGRTFYDGTGGNNHAVDHYAWTGYPLAVKLGTITKDGLADVYSYEEDDMVDDPFLVKHLAHFGINVDKMEKSDKSMVELELDLNKKAGEWVAIQEAGSNLKPLYGGGYTGLQNIGNSCYMNSAMQVIFSIPDFQCKYVDNAVRYMDAVEGNPADDFNTQMAKLGEGLLSGKYSKEPPNNYENTFSVYPHMFKAVVSKGSFAFSSKNQQDVQEFFLHVLSVMQRNSARTELDPTECFKIKIEDRIQCSTTSKVMYNYRTEYCLPLGIPLEAAVNKDAVDEYTKRIAALLKAGKKTGGEEPVRPHVPLSACLEAFIENEIIHDFASPGLAAKTTASKTTKISAFPPYLVIHMKKFTVNQDWTVGKLDVALDMPDVIDLAAMRGSGIQPGEEVMFSNVSSEEEETLYIDEGILNELMSMGFNADICKRAIYYTKNEGLEHATNWLMEHMNEDGILETYPLPNAPKGSKETFVLDENALLTIMDFGFSRNQAYKALKETNNDVERAADWIFSHPVEVNMMDVDEEAKNPSEEPQQQLKTDPASQNESTRYRLKAFISHMGRSSNVGHYVCHILRDDHWVIYNDEKVALSENPPVQLGYIYFYERF